MISIIIPVYNRVRNLELTLEALSQQIDCPRFEVIIADDGSTEDHLSLLRSYEGSLLCRYVWWPHDGFQAGAVRNLGCKVASGDAYLFLDSDILLNPVALAHYSAFFQANPDAIIAGEYDWLPPRNIRLSDVRRIAKNGVAGVSGMKDIKTKGYLGYVGKDPRLRTIPEQFANESPCKKIAPLLYSGNILVPAKDFWALGGFDVNMRGHGGEDCEFGIRAQIAGYSAIFSSRVVGYHVWHYRDQESNKADLRVNIEYIRSKHDLASVGLYMWEVGDDVGILPRGVAPSL